MKKLFLHLAVICIIFLILTNAQKSMLYAADALTVCFTVIVPTLFPFFICSGLLIYSGFCESLAKLFRFCMMPLFRINPAGASAFVLGIVSGYPLGASSAGELYRNSYITKTEAERLLAFCNNSGPLFIIGSVGLAVYSDIRYGIMLYVFHVLAAITVGIIFRFYKRNSYIAPKTQMTSPERSLGEIFGIALDNAIHNMLLVCGAVLFFSVISRIALDYMPFNTLVMSVAQGMTELVTGTVAVGSLDIDLAVRLVLTSFTVGFAGLSVHFQVMAVISRYGLSLVPYIIGKLLHGIIAALYTMIFLRLHPITEAAFSPSAGRAFAASSSVLTAAVLLLAALVFMSGIALRKSEKEL
ncbi:MAG: hypothetical protein SOS24_03175 [Clostridia bacterium]|nr:hypothetical protein [Clostridia bacterium]